jgi:hypothetical protein
MKGEFDNFDPIGIVAGARIKADCSINWIDPDDGGQYLRPRRGQQSTRPPWGGRNLASPRRHICTPISS